MLRLRVTFHCWARKGRPSSPPGGRERRVPIACLLACRRLRSAPMPLRGQPRPGGPLAAALAVGLAVRVLRLLRDPLIHPDGPAYLGLASGLLHGKVLAVLGGYYSPLYPAAVAGLAASGLRLELAGRATALLAGLAALPLVHALVRRLAGERAADAAVLLAAVHPALVKASAQVLPETLAGALLLAWLVARRAAIAGALAGGAYLARPEGVLLLPLGLWRPPPRAPPRARPLCGRRRGRHGAGAAWFTALPLALNPSPRYAVPLVPLLLPATAAGLLALGERLGRHARVATVALGVALVVQALWVSHPFDAACSREVSRLVLERY